MYVLEAARNTNTIRTALSTIATLLQLTSYRYPLAANVNDGATFDYIVVGAGSAGSIVAARLSEDESVSVLLIEAGGDPPMESNLPALMIYDQKSRLDWNHKSQVDKTAFQCLQNNQMHLGHGKVLGGTGSINYMFYVRGDPKDFDTWASRTGDESWNYVNVLPYFKKSERLEDCAVLNSCYGTFHGTDGNIGVTRLKRNGAKKYLKALKELGHKIILDNNGDDILGFSEPMMTLSDGIRQSTANSFLSKIKERPNLFVMKESLATKIIIDKNKIARGVRVANSKNGSLIAKARKEVIISAGAMNSPQLLMLSGIGPAKELKKQNIKVIADLPVGEKLKSHEIVVLIMKMKKSNVKPKPLSPHEYPTVAVNGFVALNASQRYPDYQLLISDANAKAIVQFCTQLFSYTDDICQYLYEETKEKDSAMILLANSRDTKRGHVILKSSNPMDSPKFHMEPFPVNKVDLEEHIDYLEDLTRIVNTTMFRSLHAEIVTLPKCKSFTKGSRDYWKCYLQCFGTTSFHYGGTCPMGAVVDSRLRVFGVQRLRVADASVMPTMTSGNPNAATMMIGEKAADMIKEDNRCRG